MTYVANYYLYLELRGGTRVTQIVVESADLDKCVRTDCDFRDRDIRVCYAHHQRI